MNFLQFGKTLKMRKMEISSDSWLLIALKGRAKNEVKHGKIVWFSPNFFLIWKQSAIKTFNIQLPLPSNENENATYNCLDNSFLHTPNKNAASEFPDVIFSPTEFIFETFLGKNSAIFDLIWLVTLKWQY